MEPVNVLQRAAFESMSACEHTGGDTDTLGQLF